MGQPYVWIEGGLAQDQSAEVAVIDTDVSDFCDEGDVESAERTLAAAREAEAPAHVIAAAEAALAEIRARAEGRR